MTHAEKEVRNLEIVKMRHNGKSMSEIAELCGLTLSAIHCICKRYNVAGVVSDRKSVVENPKNQYTNGQFDREANAIRYINERTPQFEYAGNFTGIDGFVDLKCKTCGTVITKSFVSVKHGTARCDVCYQRELDEKHKAEVEAKEQQKEQAKEQRKQQKYKRLFESEIVQLEFPTCECCGRLYVPRKQGVKYCSSECMTRANNAIRKDRRVKKLKAIVVDRGITLKRLYERDKGVCYMCGCTCDWEDYEVRPDGTFVAHDNYPSIDHIQPISKGGLHSWGNVRLACRKCNYQKSDVYLPSA